MPIDNTPYETDGDLAKYTDSLIVTKDSREPDWDTLSFQAKAGDQYQRAQIRYVGSGATGNHEDDNRIIRPAASPSPTCCCRPAPRAPSTPTTTPRKPSSSSRARSRSASTAAPTRSSSRTLGYRDMIVVPAGVPAQPEERRRHRRPVLRHHRHAEAAGSDVPRDAPRCTASPGTDGRRRPSRTAEARASWSPAPAAAWDSPRPGGSAPTATESPSPSSTNGR